jgi:hypothetical protein
VVQPALRTQNEVVKTAIALLIAFTGVSAANGKDKKPKQDNSSQDQIIVLAHIPASGGPITRFIPTQHYGHSYVYAEHESGKNLTVIDLSKPGKPTVLADVTYPDAATVGNVVSATGTAALVSDTPEAARPLPSETIRIMNFSDPLHPTVAQEFKGVTATSRGAQPGLILLANPDGIWILQQHYGLDPAEEECYAHYVIYGSSQFCPPHP